MDKKQIFEIVDKLLLVKEEIEKFTVEREEVLETALICLVANRNQFILGKKGQSKTGTIQSLAKRITGSKFYSKLLTKSTPDSDLFGTQDINALMQGKQKSLSENMIQEANIVFLDEFFKANDVLLNTLLPLLNFEKINIKGEEVEVPVLANFAASNEIPDFDDEDNAILEPLYDRFHIKVITEYIKDEKNYKKALQAKRNGLDKIIKNTISLDELKMLNEAVKFIEVSDECDDKMWEICNKINDELKYEISDRKKIEYSVIVQANALLNKRTKVDIKEDFKILKYYLWDKESHIKDIEKIIEDSTKNDIDTQIENILIGIKESFDETISNISLDVSAREKVESCMQFEQEAISTCNVLLELADSLGKLTEEQRKRFKNATLYLEELNVESIKTLNSKVENRYQISPRSIYEEAKRSRIYY